MALSYLLLFSSIGVFRSRGVSATRAKKTPYRGLQREYKISGSTVKGVDGYYEGSSVDRAFNKGTSHGDYYRLWFDETGGRRWIVDRLCHGCRVYTAALLQAIDSSNRPVPLDLQWFKKRTPYQEFAMDEGTVREEEMTQTSDFGSADSEEEHHMKIEETTNKQKVSFYGTVWIQSVFDYALQIDGAYTGSALPKLQFEGPNSCYVESECATTLLPTEDTAANSLYFNVENRTWELAVKSNIVAWSDPIDPRHAWNQLVKCKWNPRENQASPSPLTLRRWKFLKRGNERNYGKNKYCDVAAAKKIVFSLEGCTICDCQALAAKDPSCGRTMWAGIPPQQERNGTTTCFCLKRGEDCDSVTPSTGSSIYVEEYRLKEELRTKYNTEGTQQRTQEEDSQAPRVLEFDVNSPLGLTLNPNSVVLDVEHDWLYPIKGWRIVKVGGNIVENFEAVKKALADLKTTDETVSKCQTKVEITFQSSHASPMVRKRRRGGTTISNQAEESDKAARQDKANHTSPTTSKKIKREAEEAEKAVAEEKASAEERAAEEEMAAAEQASQAMEDITSSRAKRGEKREMPQQLKKKEARSKSRRKERPQQQPPQEPLRKPTTKSYHMSQQPVPKGE